MAVKIVGESRLLTFLGMSKACGHKETMLNYPISQFIPFTYKVQHFFKFWHFQVPLSFGICKLDSGGGAVLEHCSHRTAPLRA